MGVTFSEGRDLPREFTRGGGYEAYGAEFTEQGAVNFVKSISPWDMLTGIFVTKPAQERAAEVAIAQAQGQAQAVRSQSTRTLVMVGGGIAALLAFGLLLRPRRSSVGNYRRKSRRTRRSRR